MSKVLTETKASELLKVSAGEREVLRELIEEFERRVTATFEQSEEVKEDRPQLKKASSAAGAT